MTPQTQTTSTVDSLSELRVKVAELCGWKIVEGIYGYPPRKIIDRIIATFPGLLGVGYCEVPDYPSDLNACAELLVIARKAGWDVQIRNTYLPPGWECQLWKDGRCEVGESETLAVAICRAFVALHEEKK